MKGITIVTHQLLNADTQTANDLERLEEAVKRAQTTRPRLRHCINWQATSTKRAVCFFTILCSGPATVIGIYLILRSKAGIARQMSRNFSLRTCRTTKHLPVR